MEVANKINKLSTINSDVNSRYLRVMTETEFIDFTNPVAVQDQAGPAQPP